MDKIEAIVELADSNETLDWLLTEIFNECTSNKMSISFKQAKLKTILKNSSTKKVVNKYQKISANPYLLLLKLLSQEELKGKNKNEIIEYFSSEQSLKKEDINNLCSALLYIPGIIEPNLNHIVDNHKKGLYLFNGIEGFCNIEYSNTSEVDIKIKELENDIYNLNSEINKIKKENNKLTKYNYEVEKENKSQKKKIKELETKINRTLQNDIQKLTNISNKYKQDLSLMTRDRDKYKGLYDDKVNKIEELQESVAILEEKIKKSYTEEELCISKDIENEIFIHTSNIGITKLVYGEITFASFDEIKDTLINFIDEISLNGISIVYLETNQISSYIVSKIKLAIRNKSMILRCIMFNNERELIEELAIIKRYM